MNWKKGIQRITVLISFLITIPAIMIMLESGLGVIEFIIWTPIIFAVPYAVFYIGLWVVRGFRNPN